MPIEEDLRRLGEKYGDEDTTVKAYKNVMERTNKPLIVPEAGSGRVTRDLLRREKALRANLPETKEELRHLRKFMTERGMPDKSPDSTR